MDNEDRWLYFNGIDGDTGDYALQPQRLDEFVQKMAARGLRPAAEPRLLEFGLDPLDLADAGWGVIWPLDLDPAIREALEVLLDHRREQSTRRSEKLYRELTYLSGESTLEFWQRHGASPNTVDPEQLPYYLLIVGEPRDIPFSFQFELAMPHAVGRICFDAPEDYAAYARHVVAADAPGRPQPDRRTIGLFGVENPDDELTRRTVENLVAPLQEKIAAKEPDWRLESVLGDAARKAWLVDLLAGDSRPSLLFTASHAMRYKCGTPRQLTHQGALVCADYPGKTAWTGRGSIPEDFLFWAGDVAGTGGLEGLVAFHVACYSAGTPHLDPYADNGDTVAAPEPFVASLSKQMLKCGALAVIGHVDIAMELSFIWSRVGSQIGAFDSALRAIMAGYPVGHAMDHFGQRYAQLGTLVAAAMRARALHGEDDADLRRFHLETAFVDAEGYVILGDPSVRLGVAASPADS